MQTKNQPPATSNTPRGVLILARKVGQSIVIGEWPIWVTVVSITPSGVVRIRVDAPLAISVRRKEISQDKEVA